VGSLLEQFTSPETDRAYFSEGRVPAGLTTCPLCQEKQLVTLAFATAAADEDRMDRLTPRPRPHLRLL